MPCELDETGEYDFAFIDADKTACNGFYEHCLQLRRWGARRGTLRSGDPPAQPLGPRGPAPALKLATCNAYCNINTYQGIPVDN